MVCLHVTVVCSFKGCGEGGVGARLDSFRCGRGHLIMRDSRVVEMLESELEGFSASSFQIDRGGFFVLFRGGISGRSWKWWYSGREYFEYGEVSGGTVGFY